MTIRNSTSDQVNRTEGKMSKKTDGQISISEYLSGISSLNIGGCTGCICENCLYYNSSRCPYGDCYDDYRAIENPYDKAHPDKPPRTGWSDWKTDQAYWCRGGVFYPVRYCEKFVKYKGCIIKECLKCNVAEFQDGYIDCSLVEGVGCEKCYEEWTEKNDRL